MSVFVAMLRGVNVGGNSLKMDWLREACEGIGCKDVRTYVQSGNIVFGSGASAATLGPALKKLIDAQTRLPVTVVIRSALKWQKSSPAIRSPSRKASIFRNCT